MMAVESTERKGHYVIPGNSIYLITKCGRVYNRKRDAYLATSKNPAGYINVRIKNDAGKVHTWGLHRLIAYVFIPLPVGKTIDELEVNHIDGVKSNNAISNLEWATYMENRFHAGVMGLTSKAVPISVRWVETGEVKKYRFAIEYARSAGITRDMVQWRLKFGEERIWPEGVQIRRGHSDEPWTVPDDLVLAKFKYGRSIAVQSRCVWTGQVKLWRKLGQLSDHFGFNLPTLNTWVNSKSKSVYLTSDPNMSLIQIRKFSEHADNWPEIIDPILEYEKSYATRACVVTKEATGERTFFLKQNVCAIHMGISKTLLQYRLQSAGGKVFPDGCRYSYYQDYVKNVSRRQETDRMECSLIAGTSR